MTYVEGVNIMILLTILVRMPLMLNPQLYQNKELSGAFEFLLWTGGTLIRPF